MKEGIHPEYFATKVHCTGCGESFETGSTMSEIRVAVCSLCHPFYTGKEKMLDAEGRVDRFKKKYARFGGSGKAGAANESKSAAE